MKIVRIISRLNIGGPARHAVLLDRGLRAGGHETLLVHGSLAPGEGSFEELARCAGVPTRVVRELGRRISPVSDLRALFKLIALVFREQPDVVHTHTAKAGALGRVAALSFNLVHGRTRRCVVVHTFHGHVLEGYFSRTGSWLARTAERLLASCTDRIIVISPKQRHDIVERFRIADASRTSVVFLGLDLEPLLGLRGADRSLRRQLAIGDGEVVVGFVGRLVPIKDVATLLRGLRIAVTIRPDMRLLIAGDGPLRPDLERLTSSLGLAGHVHFLGWTSDLPAFYDNIDVCAISSLNEGTPVAIIEAMAAGKAVIATAVGGVPDLVEDGSTGVLVASGDGAALGSALAELAIDAGRRAILGENARRAAARFSHERLVSEISELYVTELAKKRSAGARVKATA